MRAPHHRIVADGAQRYRAARDYTAIRTRVLAEASKRFECEKATASFWRRCWIELRIRREVRAFMNREFPPGNLYVSSIASNDASGR